MNKIVFTGFMAAILGVSGASAAVTNSSYTTKGYVDAGLREVNAKAVAAASLASSADTKATNAAAAASSASEAASSAASAAAAAQSAADDASTLATGLQTIVGADANSGLQGTVGTLSTTVSSLNTSVTALNSDINDQTNGLKAKVAALEARPAGTTYNAGDGISIDTSTNTISVNAFDTSIQSGNTDKIYVIQNGQLVEWTEPDSADTWDSSILD